MDVDDGVGDDDNLRTAPRRSVVGRQCLGVEGSASMVVVVEDDLGTAMMSSTVDWGLTAQSVKAVKNRQNRRP